MFILISFIQISGFVSFAQENTTLAFKKPAKSERVYDLNKISNDDVIKFFRKDKALRKHWQKIMDTDKDNSKFPRHVNCLTTNIYEIIKQETNFTFLRGPKEFETDIVTRLSEIVSEILNEHPKIGSTNQIQVCTYAHKGFVRKRNSTFYMPPSYSVC